MIGQQLGSNFNILGWLLHAPYEYVVGKVLAITGADSLLSR